MFPPSSLAFEVCRLEPASPWGLPCIYPWISAATWLEAWQPQPWSLRPTPHLSYDTSHLTLPCAFVPMKPNLIGYLPSSFPGSGIKCEFSILQTAPMQRHMDCHSRPCVALTVTLELEKKIKVALPPGGQRWGPSILTDMEMALLPTSHPSPIHSEVFTHAPFC